MRSSASSFSRRRFIQGVGGFTFSGSILSKAFAVDVNPDLVTVSILHTTDLHGHIVPTHTYPDKDGAVVEDVGGLARCVTQIRAWQKENPHNLLLDIGDIYQGTHVSLSNHGQLMMRLLNSMNYDAWVIGNHEFDWGLQPMVDVVRTSTVPVIASNAKQGGQWVNRLDEKINPLGKIKPYIIKEVAGFKIGIIGTVTPGLPAWLAPKLLQEFSAEDPIKSIDYAMKRLRTEKVDAIILASHFGLKGKGRLNDDFANPINRVADECVGIDAIIAGHTHKDLPDEKVRGVPYTQANYYGINCGRLDLVFSKTSRKLVDIRPLTKLMDKSVEQDPMILSASAKEREDSDKEVARVIGELKDTLSKDSTPGTPSESLRLLTRAMRYSLQKRQISVDGVLHGAFYEFDVKPGPKTIGDAWEVVPYENFLAVAGFTPAELKVVLEECVNTAYSTHGLDGFKVTAEKVGKNSKILDITLPDGKPLEPEKRYRIALNSYDAQSGGRRYLKLNEIATVAAAKLETYDIQSREALIEFFTEKKVISKSDLA